MSGVPTLRTWISRSAHMLGLGVTERCRLQWDT
jgi:hypothetical protein